MNTEYNCKVSSKNSKPLLKNLQNTVGDYFFLPHPVHVPIPIQLPQRNSASAAHVYAADALFLCGS